MGQTKELWQHPIFFRRNRVSRVYLGGKLFHGLLGDPAQDDRRPEEWICSSTRAINSDKGDALEGVSICEENGIAFDRLLTEYPTELLGNRKELGVLVKYLDSAIRLPMQVHPTRAFSQENFRSPYGKAEAWLILDTRQDACIYLGFRDKMTKASFSEIVEQSRTNRDVMPSVANRIPVRAGDVFFVEAGVIHAIGEGCLILEVQEPTDFTIQPEYWCGEYLLNDQEMYLGLDKMRALDCFRYDLYGEKVVCDSRKVPSELYQDQYVRIESLIDAHVTPCFAMQRYTLRVGSMELNMPASIWICLSGTGTIHCGEWERSIHRGEYFFLPAAAKKCSISSRDIVQLICCSGGIM